MQHTILQTKPVYQHNCCLVLPKVTNLVSNKSCQRRSYDVCHWYHTVDYCYLGSGMSALLTLLDVLLTSSTDRPRDLMCITR